MINAGDSDSKDGGNEGGPGWEYVTSLGWTQEAKGGYVTRKEGTREREEKGKRRTLTDPIKRNQGTLL
jgi:hypothetical protein